jgi:hypothetical protein
MIRSIAAVSLLSLAFATGCAIQAHTDFDPQVDFAKYKTFTMAPPPQGKPKGLVGYSAISARRIQEEIASALQTKGYNEVSQGDMVVAFSVTGEPRTDLVGYGPGWYGDTYTQHYVQGNLVINIYEAKTRELVWHGWASAQIYDSQQAEKEGPKAVQAIMKKFPPK